MVVQRDPRCRYTEGRMAEARSATPVLDLRLPSPVEELHDDVPARHGVSLYLKRDDLIHPEIPGNKWRKLKHDLSRPPPIWAMTRFSRSAAPTPTTSAPLRRPAITLGSRPSV